jgi:CRISPR-associated exonuclease Cas4
MVPESELIMLSALQHYVFCPRQCALIHIEQIWEENGLTAEGRGLHDRAHSESAESRPDCRRIFGMPLRSLELGITGKSDVVMETPEGVFIPLEYKRGKPKVKEMDTVQLCGQALCLEEMTGKPIQEGYIYYFRIRKRLHVLFDQALRDFTIRTISETRAMLEGGKTPLPVYSKRCESCSLNDLCRPELIQKKLDINDYLDRMLSKELSETTLQEGIK